MTNYEKIKEMSIDEMALTLMCPAEYDTAFNKTNKCNAEMDKNCHKCTVEWLESEAEE